MRLEGRLVRVTDLSDDDKDRMFDLMDRHYENLCGSTFEADLQEKQWVIQVFHRATGALCGFSTQMLLAAVVDDQPIRALFSGDTIIDRRYWGDQALTHEWGCLAMSLIAEYPEVELYWLLISQGYKTYRFLPVFFHEFYPRVNAHTPRRAGRVIDILGRMKFGEHYDTAARVVRASWNQYRLRAGVADVTPERQRDPNVQFFVEKNPHFAAGDELCCLAPLSRDNFTPAAHRVIGSEPSIAKAY
jgi:hypothetical protein